LLNTTHTPNAAISYASPKNKFHASPKYDTSLNLISLILRHCKPSKEKRQHARGEI
jgi:hypothetical protein